VTQDSGNKDFIEHAVSPENVADPFTIQQMVFVMDYRRPR